jgi:hypothetical protein
MIGHALALLLLKVASRAPKGMGIYPVSLFVRQSLAALARDDLDGAMTFYAHALARDAGHERVRVLREILTSEIRFRRKALAADRGETGEAAQRGLRVLDGFLAVLRETGAAAGEAFKTRPGPSA